MRVARQRKVEICRAEAKRKQEEEIMVVRQRKEEEERKRVARQRKVEEERRANHQKEFGSLLPVSSSPQVSRRTEGWGVVRTGQVTNTKMSLYTRAASTERDIPDTPGQKRRLVSPTPRTNVKTGDVALN